MTQHYVYQNVSISHWFIIGKIMLRQSSKWEILVYKPLKSTLNVFLFFWGGGLISNSDI